MVKCKAGDVTGDTQELTEEMLKNHMERPIGGKFRGKRGSETSMDSATTGLTGLTGVSGLSGLEGVKALIKKRKKQKAKPGKTVILEHVDEASEEDNYVG